jgi:uracil-DNA glycosylase family 4
MRDSLKLIERDIVHCERCPRLRAYCQEVARVKRRMYREEEYWGRPVPGFGDPAARLFLLGLAPGAHGANRTGRVFTGDSSGDWLYAALFDTGFANQSTSTHRNDGLQLRDAWVSASARCAPPDNQPLPEEFDACRPYLERELRLLRKVRVVVALGKLAFDNYTRLRGIRGLSFAHGMEHTLGSVTLLCSYHPSRQNTQTGRLTRQMWLAVFQRARALLA